MKFNSKRGFTLIELLVVIAIIGILSSVVLASLNSAREKSRDARRVGDIKQLQLALELYFDTNQSYPDVLGDLSPTFIPVDPRDPVGNAFYFYNAYKVDSLPPNAINDCNDVDEGNNECIFYHLGGDLEGGDKHVALTGDADQDGVGADSINGTDATACRGAPARYCYDLVP